MFFLRLPSTEPFETSHPQSSAVLRLIRYLCDHGADILNSYNANGLSCHLEQWKSPRLRRFYHQPVETILNGWLVSIVGYPGVILLLWARTAHFPWFLLIFDFFSQVGSKPPKWFQSVDSKLFVKNCVTVPQQSSWIVPAVDSSLIQRHDTIGYKPTQLHITAIGMDSSGCRLVQDTPVRRIG